MSDEWRVSVPGVRLPREGNEQSPQASLCAWRGRGGRNCEFLLALGDLDVTGPTRTNVNDYRAILVL